METKWPGIMKVLEIQHLDVDGKLLWKQNDVLNQLHAEGESFILETLFAGNSVPDNYYLGLDNRSTISRNDTLSTTSSTEPTGFGYNRNTVPSSGSFSVELGESGVFQASSPIIAYSASGGNWGPVSNLFLTDQSDNNGNLISSVQLSSAVTVTNGQTINVRIAMTLRDCP